MAERRVMVTILLVVVLFITSLGVGSAMPPAHRIVINLPAYRLYHYVGDGRAGVYDISIGHVSTPTPVTSSNRRFEIFQMVKNPVWRNPRTRQLVPPGPSNPLGTRWLGLMKIDRVVLTGRETWEALARQYRTTVTEILRANNLRQGAVVRAGQVVEIPYHNGYGIHGTNVPLSIGTAVSLGCMRMRNADVERLFDALPSGRRVPVTILYEPWREYRDLVSLEPYIEVFFDVYRRVPDWSAGLTAAAARINAPISRWQLEALLQRFTGSHILSHSPLVHNNNTLVMVGARHVEGEFYLPPRVVEQMLGVEYRAVYGEHFLGEWRLKERDIYHKETGVLVSARVISEIAGRAYFFDELRNTLEFSVTRLAVQGNFLGYNRVLLHHDAGPMVAVADVAPHLGLAVQGAQEGRVRVGGLELVGLSFGEQTFVCLRELRRLPLNAEWDPRSGLLAISHRR
ncbi:MAG: L,D-transpeptidase family protein [Dethiobacter sp.]|nr:L,D-transpeptidase family protein [Dethiobacter sp.]MBS4055450.1 L,D-transpeptidase family protein [Thermaerobacter sp.]